MLVQMCRVSPSVARFVEIVIPAGRGVNSKGRQGRVSHLPPRQHLRTITTIAKSRREERINSEER